MNNESDTKKIEQKIDVRETSLAESFVLNMNKAPTLSGREAFRCWITTGNEGVAMLGTILGDDGKPKYFKKENDTGNYNLEQIAKNLFDPDVVPKVDADFSGRESTLVITVGKLSIAATKDTTETSMNAALDMAFELAGQKVAKDVFHISYLLGVEGVLDPHTILSEYGIAHDLKSGADESLNIAKLVQQETEKRMAKIKQYEKELEQKVKSLKKAETND